MIEVYRPKWEGNKERAVGIAEYRLAHEGNIVEINITYKNKEGLRLYPDPFYMRKVDIVKHPVENASGTKVYVIPICELSTSPNMNKKYVQYDIKCPKCNELMKQNLNGIMVSYKCSTCGKKSAIEWELGKPELKEVEEEPKQGNMLDGRE